MERVGYWYYMIHRPPSPGAQPKQGLVRCFSYEERMYIEAIGCKAWGSVVYDRPLTQKEIEDYELVPMPEDQWKYQVK